MKAVNVRKAIFQDFEHGGCEPKNPWGPLPFPPARASLLSWGCGPKTGDVTVLGGC